MQIPKRLPTLTQQDLKALQSEQTPQDIQKYQSFLDRTGTKLLYVQLSQEERAQVRQAVDHPEKTLAGSALLHWNNMCRPKSFVTRF